MSNIKVGFNLNQKVCSSIIQHFAEKYSLEAIYKTELKPCAVLELDNETYIIDRKNQKLAQLLIDYYQEGKKYHIIAPITVYLMIQVLSLAMQIDLDLAIAYLNLKDPYVVEVSADDLLHGVNEYTENLEDEEYLSSCIETMNAMYEGKKEEIKIEKYDTYLRQYSEYFHLDGDKVVDIAKKLTNHYQDNFAVALSDSAMEDYDLKNVIDNPETGALLFNYFIYRNVNGNDGELAFKISDFGYSKNDLVTTREIETIDYDYENGETLVLTNGLTRSQFTGKICDLLGMDKAYTLAISYAETGVNGSPASRNHNNYGGQKNKEGELMGFPRAEAGLIAQALNLKTYPSKYGVNSLEKLWEVYAEKGEDWLPNVKQYHRIISSDPSSYFIENPNIFNYQESMFDEESLAWNQSDLSYHTDNTFSYNVKEDTAVLMKKL